MSAFGHGVEPFWRGLAAGESGLRPIRRISAPDGALAGQVPPLEAHALVRAAVSRRIDWVSLMALAAARLALADAGLEPGGLDPSRTALALGSAFSNLHETATFLDRLFERGSGYPLLFPNLVFNSPLSYVSIELGVTGPTVMIAALEASGEAAIAWGAETVAAGAAEVCLAGGTEELSAVVRQVFDEGGLVGRHLARPLDPAADGAVPGEGAAVLVLESLPRARARGASIYARLVPQAGFAVPSPVHGWPRDPAPLAERLSPVAADADVVFAAASGRPALDEVEAAALAAVAGRRAAVTAVRGAIGDFGAAGALAAAAAARSVAEGIVPPTLGLVPPARAGLDVVVGGSRRLPVRVAVVDGLARGGLCRPLRLEAP